MTEGSDRRKKLIVRGGIAAAVLLIIAGVGIWWFLKDDAPDAVNLEDAVAVANADTAAGGSDTSEPEVSGVAGSWAVDPTIGEFAFESATGSFVGFRIAEELSTIGSTTAVGRTGDVTGTLAIDGATLTETTITADMSTVTTNDSRRDSKARSALGVSEFQNAVFTLAAPIDLGAAAEDGSPVSVTAVGDLTIKGVTNQVEFELEAQFVNGVIAVVGSTNVVFADYGVTVPSAPIILSVADNGIIEFQLLFVRS
ncbi:MAG: polyisoprenoid-binding protein YceI [Candidatus Poriferisodalaceae bacterium]